MPRKSKPRDYAAEHAARVARESDNGTARAVRTPRAPRTPRDDPARAPSPSLKLWAMFGAGLLTASGLTALAAKPTWTQADQLAFTRFLDGVLGELHERVARLEAAEGDRRRRERDLSTVHGARGE